MVDKENDNFLNLLIAAQVQETQKEPKPKISNDEAAAKLPARHGEDGLPQVSVPVG